MAYLTVLYRRRWANLAFLLVLSAWMGSAAAQEVVNQQEPEKLDKAWQPPDLADLPLDYWTQVDVNDPAITDRRTEQFFASARERVGGLDAENLVAGQASLANLRNLVELLVVTRQDTAPLQFEPIPTQTTYLLEDVLKLQERRGELRKQRVQTTLEIEQTERKIQLLGERRDRLVRAYQATDKESPDRILTGLERVAARVEYETELLRIERQQTKLEQIEKQILLIEEQQAYAQTHLDAKDVSIEALETALAEARAEVVASTEQQAGLQKQLLDVVSATEVNPSLELLRSQQLTRASADAALAQIKAAMARAKLEWYRFRAGELGSDFDSGQATAQARQLTTEILKQIDVWFSASQATLVAPPPGNSANALANFQIAQTVARDTLVIIEQIRDLSADLLLVRNILAEELIAAQSGLGKAWSRLGLAVSGFWERLSGILDTTLFSMGEAPVTPGGIFKMVLILALAWGVSWFLRHLLERLGRRRQFTNSPAIYTLGRLSHYILITIGVFAALASIGIDFSNFALIAGALSVGIGFGLQAIVNNFVSGLILLFEGSLRVGDHIELDSGLAGVVREINTRATVVNTTDGIDVVVPNSELVTTKLTNWTLRESMARVRIKFGVAYGSDKEKVREVALEAAHEMEFIILNMPGREPQVRLVNFGDSSLDFELLAWVSRQGVRRPHRVRASFLWALETGLNEAGIEIPFPQRDLHIKSDDTRGRSE